MRVSLWPSANQPWEDLLAVARHADAGRWHRLYLEDHFIEHPPHADRPLLEVTAALSGLAAATTRIGLGPLVMSVTYRHPAVIANWAAAADLISHGRLVLGLGAGWEELEHRAYGLRLGPLRERVDRFEEGLQVVRGLLDTPRTTVSGRYYTLVDAAMEPKPAQAHLPLLVGARGDRMLGLVARYADEWNMWSVPAELQARAEVLDAACERIGRDPATIWRSTQAPVLVTNDPVRAEDFRARIPGRAGIAGSVEQVAAAIAEYAEVGIDEFIIPDVAWADGAEQLAALDDLVDLVDRG